MRHLAIGLVVLTWSGAALADPDPAASTQPPHFVDEGLGQRRTGLIIGGVGIATIGGALVWGLAESSRYHDDTTPIAEKDAIADRVRIWGTTGFLLGATAVATGAVLYLTAPGRRRLPAETAVVPVMGDGQVGLAALGTF
jgi:hypothetical protein